MRQKLNAIHFTKEQQLQREQQQAVNKALDKTRDNIKKITNKAKKEISHDIQIVNNYQENTIQAIRTITDNFVDFQKGIIVTSFRLWSYWITSPRQVAEIYYLLFKFYIT